MPEVRTAPAPAWLKPGLRITYFSASASVRGARTNLVEDENGNWVDKASGQKYSEQEVASGGSGAGYTQIDIASLDAKAVTLDIHSYSSVVVPGKITVLGSSGVVTPPGAGSDFWIPPDALEKALALDSPGLRILRMPYRIGERAFKAIRIQSTSAQGWQAWTYDEETGLLLHSGSSTQGAAQTIAKEGEAPAAGATLLTMNTLVGTRQVDVPWAASAAPAWTGTTRALVYRGDQTMPVPGTQPIPLACNVRFDFLRAGPAWLRFRQTMEVGGGGGLPPAQSAGERATGSAEFLGLWIASEAVAALRTGQVLDRDPVTHVVVSVAWMGRGRDGSDLVTVRAAGDAHRIDATYDARTGLLVAVEQTDSLFVTRLAIAGRE